MKLQILFAHFVAHFVDGTQRAAVDGMLPPAVTPTFDLLIQKPNQYVSRPSYVCDLILVKLAP